MGISNKVCLMVYVQGCMSKEYVQVNVCPRVSRGSMSKEMYVQGGMNQELFQGVCQRGYIQKDAWRGGISKWVCPREFVQVGISMIISISGVYPR